MGIQRDPPKLPPGRARWGLALAMAVLGGFPGGAAVPIPGPGGNVPFISLPDCMGLLPDFETEWWYYAGHLRCTCGESFSIQVEALRTRTLGTGLFDQLAVAEVGIGRQRDQSFLWSLGFGLGVGRSPAGWASLEIGAGRNQYSVTLSPWLGAPLATAAPAQMPERIQFLYTGGAEMGTAGARYTLTARGIGGRRGAGSPVTAVATPYALRLSVTDCRGVVLEGHSGYVAGATLESYEFGQPRLEVTDGSLSLGEEKFEVAGGNLWLDRQAMDKAARIPSPWQPAAHSQAEAGGAMYLGTWLALTFHNGVCMNLASFWTRSSPQWLTGTLLGRPPLPSSFGNLYYPLDGRRRPSGAADLHSIEGDGYDFDVNVCPGSAAPSWTSPVSGQTYASTWQVRFGPRVAEALGLDTVYLHALVNCAENLLPDRSNAFWEGAVRVSSDPEGREVVGYGFAEQMGFN